MESCSCRPGNARARRSHGGLEGTRKPPALPPEPPQGAWRCTYLELGFLLADSERMNFRCFQSLSLCLFVTAVPGHKHGSKHARSVAPSPVSHVLVTSEIYRIVNLFYCGREVGGALDPQVEAPLSLSCDSPVPWPLTSCPCCPGSGTVTTGRFSSASLAGLKPQLQFQPWTEPAILLDGSQGPTPQAAGNIRQEDT